MTPLSPTALLARLRDLDVKIWVEGERLRINAPKDVLTPELRAELTAGKAALIEMLGHAPGVAVAESSLDGATAPLSFSQQRLWFLDQLRPNSPEYNIPGATRIVGALNHEALERAIAAIIERHDVLRTHFAMVDGAPVQVVEPPRAFRVTVHDLRELPESDRDRHVRELLLAEAARSFDLARGPLFRATVYRVGDEEHIVMLVLHHSVGDGWSGWIFIQELVALYTAFVRGEPSSLPPLPMQYADFARWQRQWMEGDALKADLEYWTGQLEGLNEALELPTDRPRPPVQTSNGALEKMVFPTELMERVEAASRREGVTPFMMLLAAFTTVLARYSGQDDITLGTPIANRTRVDFESLIGLFANTLVLRTDLSGNPPFRELLQRVREVALGAYAHQDVPFEKLVEVLHPAREMSRAPLFQVLFAFQNIPHKNFRLPGLTLERLILHSGAAQADLSLHVGRDGEGEGYALAFEYNTDLFDGTTIHSMGEHFLKLTGEAVDDPSQHIMDVPMLSEEELHRLLVEWNATDAPVPQGGVHELIGAQARRTPDAVAVVFEDLSMTYAELHGRSLELAAHLRSLGVGPGVFVALCADRSLDMFVGLLGILNAGGAYVPLDPAYPADRLTHMLEDAGCPVVVTQAHLRQALPATDARVVMLDEAPWPESDEGAGTAEAVGGDDPAYAIFTSGSTGRPKGVQVPHRALVNLLASMARAPGLGPEDTLLAVTTLSFDIAGLELYLPLIVGARVVLASREAALDPARLAALIERERVTVMQATPATWRLLTEYGWRGPASFKILCGGETLPVDLARTLTGGEAEVWNLYGPTETTIWSTVHRLDRDASAIPIGRPIANTRVYVLDACGAPTPVGVPGELYIGGTGVALGYLNRPDLTADRFVSDPFAGEPKARMYRTGDRVRWRTDETLEHLGRLDTQVKVRGFRVELSEIETVLARHPAIAHAVAHVIPDASGAHRLVAYVVTSGSGIPPVAELRSHLAAHLPEYMIPSSFTELERVPLTPNGKVDRRRLPAPDANQVASAGSYVAPRTELERVVADVWRDALGVQAVGATDNFFDLGGHSLLIVKVHSELRAKLDHDLSIVEMFQYPTVRALAERLSRQMAASN